MDMKSETPIMIRADANEIIGTGHVMRCLSIAEQIRGLGGEVKFVIADNHSQPMIENRDFETICLNSKWNDLDCETEELIHVIQKNNVKRLLIDSYYVTYEYLKQLKETAFIAYIDDMFSFAYPIDLLINYNFYADIERYCRLYKISEQKPKFVLGCKYAPLRKEFSNIHKEIRLDITSILITTGGTDNFNVTGHLIERLLQEKNFGNFEFYFVVGRFNKNVDLLKSKYGNYKNIHFLINISDMAKYMKQCDIAVTAGGTTTYELFASGIPSVIYTLADNQLEIARTVSELGIVPYAGDIREDMGLCIDNILGQISIYSESFDLRKDTSLKMQSYIDGKGSGRIAELLVSH